MQNAFEKLYKEDQKHTKLWAEHYTDKEYYEINKKLQSKLKKLLKKENLKAKDYFIAAMIFHHGFNQSSSKKAIKYAKLAVNKGYNSKWLIASATDRLLQLQGKPQKFGTQITELKSGKIKMYKIDNSITDKERREYGLLTLKELKKRLKL